jgi:hypothetical protein
MMLYRLLSAALLSLNPDLSVANSPVPPSCFGILCTYPKRSQDSSTLNLNLATCPQEAIIEEHEKKGLEQPAALAG